MQHNAATNSVYLNNAATAWPRAPGAVAAILRELENLPVHPGRSVSIARDVCRLCRDRLASLLNVPDANRVVLCQHATQALNLAIHGFSLKKGDRVITTCTEHNSVLRPLVHRSRSMNVEMIVLPLVASGVLDETAFEEALSKGAKLVVMNHVSNVTGIINDVGRYFAMARESGAVTLLDASQSMGRMEVNPIALNADMVAFTGHKGLLGPPGTGGLWVSPDITLEQTQVGGTGVRSDLLTHPEEMPIRLEAGTPNTPALAGLAAALDWLTTQGKSHLARERELGERLFNDLRNISGIQIAAPDVRDRLFGIVSFAFERWSTEDAGCILESSYGIACRSGLHCAPLIHEALGFGPEGTIRFSLSGFNTQADIDYALRAVREMAA